MAVFSLLLEYFPKDWLKIKKSQNGSAHTVDDSWYQNIRWHKKLERQFFDLVYFYRKYLLIITIKKYFIWIFDQMKKKLS